MRLSIFDTNTHLSLPNSAEEDRGFLSARLRKMRHSNIDGALVLNLPELNPGVSQIDFVRRVSAEKQLVPVPCFETLDVSLEEARLRSLVSEGICGVKLHPRQLGTRLSDARVSELIQAASDLDLVVFLCTYPHIGRGAGVEKSFLPEVLEHQIPAAAKVVLMHGGATQLLDTAEWARRQGGSVLIDLSWTLTELWRSSVRFDLVNVCERFEQQVTFGSDYPFIPFQTFSRRLRQLARRSRKPLKHAVSGDNVRRFVGLQKSP